MSIYRWILSYLLHYWKQMLLFIGCGLIITSVELSITKYVQYFVDRIVPNKMMDTFLWSLLFLGLLVVVMLLAQAWSTMLSRKVVELASKDLMLNMFRQLRKLGFAFFEQKPVGETIGLFHTELAAAQRIIRQYTPELIRHTISLFIMLAFVITLSWRLSVWIIPFFLLYYLVGPYFEKKAATWTKQVNKERQLANKGTYDSVAAIHEVRAFGASKWSIDRLIHQIAVLHGTQLKRNFYAYARGTVRRITIGLGAVAIFANGIWLVQHTLLTVGEFVAYSILYFQVIRVLTVVVTLTTEQRLLLQQLETIYHFMQKEPQVQEKSHTIFNPDIKGQFEFQNVSFSYPNRPNVVQQFSLNIKAGEKVALVGTSGGGKSTLLKLICRFYDPDQGEIYLDGIPLKDYSFSQLRSSIGFVFQETYLFGGTVRENLLFGHPDASENEVVAAAKAAYAHDFIMQLPNGYDTVVGERGIVLSGGQKQRIAIARMFIKNPAIVLLDEATSALDNVSENEVQKALDSLLAGRTTIAVAHRLSTVKHFDRLVVIHEGSNAEQGSYEQLVARHQLFYRLLQGSGMEAAHE
ncbi:ABC transporter ATP-binding protein [Paenibacillus paeoniae]|uniref:ABC transporter ATP-binding protein n=1 Tax=Paenibacillus paeoniae TaxID=2292705 RepID=A0A371PJ42_9BACL|nr:ABC transporter ATP-binding protein [Paenibacillus paeoniae]REK76194.1 ABC transporter ATP-binding protein [Paenibacillus paeoniae]